MGLPIETVMDEPSPACPYAVALHPDDEDQSVKSEDHEALQKCTAFEQGSCPFKDAKSADELRSMLLKMPASHFDQKGQFFKAVSVLHNPSLKDAKEGFELPGGCPMQSVLQEQQASKEDLSFTEALKHKSFADIMALEVEKAEGQDKQVAEKETSTACPYAVTLPPDDVEAHSVLSGDHEALQKCPAFEQGSCPFKDAKSADKLRSEMLKMPASHFDQKGKFFKVVSVLHNPSLKDTKQGFQLPGGCPIQPVLVQEQQASEGNLSFAEALEHMSLAGIMALEVEKAEKAAGIEHGDSDKEGHEKQVAEEQTSPI